jgi:hypothetical protein
MTAMTAFGDQTDNAARRSGIVFDEKVTGQLTIRNSQDHLIVEIDKTARVLELGLEPGLYSITLQQGGNLLHAEIMIIEGQRTLVSIKDFNYVGTEPARRKGDDEKSEALGNLYTFFFNIVYEPFPFPLIGFVNIAIGNHNIFQASFVNSNTGNFNGFQAGFINTVGGDYNGFQTGFINTVGGDFNGFQTGFVNTNIGEIKGVQLSFVNVAAQSMKGVQIGLVNYADSIDGLPIGFISIVKNGGYKAIEYFYSEYHTYNLGFKIGIDKFYTSIIFSYNQTDEYSRYNFASGLGFGSIFPIGKIFYINTEFTSLSPININNVLVNYQSFIPYFGINIGKFSIAAGPVVTWVQINNFYTANQKPRDRAALPKPNHSLRYYEINNNNSIVIGFRAAARLRF